jgi:prophage tail gpP-like protein
MAERDAVNQETFSLRLAGEFEVPIASSYTVHAGVMEVPATFEFTIGHAGLITTIADAVPPFTKFELLVGDTVVQTGETDGYAPTGSNGSEITFRGRDLTKWLVDTQIENERTFSESTFLDLTKVALTEVGLGGAALSSSNTANRKAITGTQSIKELAPPTTETQQTEAGASSSTTKTVYQTIKGEVGTTWWDFLAEQYRRAGLFLWADVTGGFVLARPDGNQDPIYRILRRRGGPNQLGEVTIVGQPSFTYDATKRFSECRVMGRSGGGKNGRGQVLARAFDQEMIELLNPEPTDQADGGTRKKPMIIKDDKVRTPEQAAFLARRKIAESRRNGWSLSYTVVGHTAPALSGGGRVIWQPDTVVHVVDDDLGIDGPMYVESLVYKRVPQATTEVHLMRIEDLLFAEEDVDNPPKKLAKKKGVANVRVGKTEVFDVQAMWKKNPTMGNLPTQARESFVGVRLNADGTGFEADKGAKKRG